MTELRKRDFLSDLLLVLSLGLFLLSTIQPFLVLIDKTVSDPFGMPRPISFLNVNYFSFEAIYSTEGFHNTISFDAYWFGRNELNLFASFPIANILVIMFTFQVLTLLLGFAILPLKPRTRIFPLITCVVTTALMSWSYYILKSGPYLTSSPFYRGRLLLTLGNGYWWAYPSMLLIVVSMILAYRRQNRMLFPKAG
jgi:hypothetical protein